MENDESIYCGQCMMAAVGDWERVRVDSLWFCRPAARAIYLRRRSVGWAGGFARTKRREDPPYLGGSCRLRVCVCVCRGVGVALLIISIPLSTTQPLQLRFSRVVMVSGSDDAEKLLKKRVNLACASLTAFVAVFELLLLWLILSADARAKRQADAVLKAVRSSTAVEFSLLPQATDPSLELRRTTRVEAVGVVATGRLVPMLSMDTGRLRFDGRMSVTHNSSLPLDSTSASASGSSAVISWSESLKTGNSHQELLVLHDQRGARFSTDEDDGLVRCLSPAGVPPLFALEAASGSAFAAQSFASFGVSCKTGRPLEVVFDHLPFVLCALDWLNDLNACLTGNVSSEELQSGRFRQVATPPTGSRDEVEVYSASSYCVKSPPLVIYGERMVLTATLEFGNSVEDGYQQTSAVSTRCGLLEAPMATESLAKLNLVSQMIPRPPLRLNTSVESYMWLPPPI